MNQGEVNRKMSEQQQSFVLEDSGEDHRIVNVAQIKTSYPTAEEIDQKQH